MKRSGWGLDLCTMGMWPGLLFPHGNWEPEPIQAAGIWRMVGCASELHSMQSSTVGLLMVVLWLIWSYKCQRNPTLYGRYMTATWPGERVCFAVSVLSWLLMTLKSLSVPKHSSYDTPEETAKGMPKKVLCPVCQVKKSQDPGAPPQLQNSQARSLWMTLWPLLPSLVHL